LVGEGLLQKRKSDGSMQLLKVLESKDPHLRVGMPEVNLGLLQRALDERLPGLSGREGLPSSLFRESRTERNFPERLFLSPWI